MEGNIMAVDVVVTAWIIIGCVCSAYFILSCTIEAITSREPALTVCGIATIVMVALAAAKIFGS
jgi:hypothetical protein